jgi:hypothetical protein
VRTKEIFQSDVETARYKLPQWFLQLLSIPFRSSIFDCAALDTPTSALIANEGASAMNGCKYYNFVT